MNIYTRTSQPKYVDTLNLRREKSTPDYVKKYEPNYNTHKKHITANTGIYEHSKTLSALYHKNHTQNETKTNYVVIDGEIITLVNYIKQLKATHTKYYQYTLHENDRLVNYIATEEATKIKVYYTYHKTMLKLIENVE